MAILTDLEGSSHKPGWRKSESQGERERGNREIKRENGN